MSTLTCIHIVLRSTLGRYKIQLSLSVAAKLVDMTIEISSLKFLPSVDSHSAKQLCDSLWSMTPKANFWVKLVSLLKQVSFQDAPCNFKLNNIPYNIQQMYMTRSSFIHGLCHPLRWNLLTQPTKLYEPRPEEWLNQRNYCQPINWTNIISRC